MIQPLKSEHAWYSDPHSNHPDVLPGLLACRNSSWHNLNWPFIYDLKYPLDEPWIKGGDNTLSGWRVPLSWFTYVHYTLTRYAANIATYVTERNCNFDVEDWFALNCTLKYCRIRGPNKTWGWQKLIESSRFLNIYFLFLFRFRQLLTIPNQSNQKVC